MLNRKVILNGERNVIQMCQEADLEVFSGEKLKVGRGLLDGDRNRLYSISKISPRVIVINEHVVGPNEYLSPLPLDRPWAVGNLVENDPKILVQKRLTSR